MGQVSHSAIEWALARSTIIDELKTSVMGNYQYILQLISVFQDGNRIKHVLDEAIDKCDRLINLREDILKNRIAYSVNADITTLERALGCLERYFLLITFSGYVSEKGSRFGTSFQEWLKARPGNIFFPRRGLSPQKSRECWTTCAVRAPSSIFSVQSKTFLFSRVISTRERLLEYLH